jgi:hypothetical protein
LASIEQVPAVRNVIVVPLATVQVPVVVEVNETSRPALLTAVREGVVPNILVPGLVNVIVWAARGITLFEAVLAVPVPALFVAVTVNV